MNAILRTDLEVERMTEKQFRNEKLYLVTMKMAKALLKKGTMSADEYKQIDMISWRNTSHPWAFYFLMST